MPRSLRRSIALFVLIVIAVAAGGVVLDEIRHFDTPERATVTFVDAPTNETLGGLDVRVAASFRERFVGLSFTDSLGPNEGMLFVHDSPGTHAYVMRWMSFPIDIVFVAPNRTVTRVYHADVEGSNGPYRGYAKWVVEAPLNWTRRHGIGPGDRLRIDWSDKHRS